MRPQDAMVPTSVYGQLILICNRGYWVTENFRTTEFPEWADNFGSLGLFRVFLGLYRKTCSGDTQNKKNEYLRRKFFCIDPFFLFWRHLTASKVSGEKIFCYRPTHQKTSIFQIYLMYGSDYYLEVLEPQNSRNGQNAFRKLFVGECWYSLKKWLGNRVERTRCSRQAAGDMDVA